MEQQRKLIKTNKVIVEYLSSFFFLNTVCLKMHSLVNATGNIYVKDKHLEFGWCSDSLQPSVLTVASHHAP